MNYIVFETWTHFGQNPRCQQPTKVLSEKPYKFKSDIYIITCIWSRWINYYYWNIISLQTCGTYMYRYLYCWQLCKLYKVINYLCHRFAVYITCTSWAVDIAWALYYNRSTVMHLISQHASYAHTILAGGRLSQCRSTCKQETFLMY